VTALFLASVGIVSFASSWLGVRLAKDWLRRRRVFDVPNQRSSHSAAVPRGGGIALAALTLSALVALAFRAGTPARSQLLLVIAGGTIIAAVSFFDDIRGVAMPIRLAVQIAAATLSLAAFGAWSPIALGGKYILLNGGAAAFLTIVWIVGLTNAYNFMDGIDLMAAGQAITAGLGWVVLGTLGGVPDLVVIGAVVAFAAAGFAVHNRPPATIFMGDVGSAFLGYLFATFCLWALQRDPILATGGVLLVWPFIFDTGFTFLCRARRREPVFSAHRSHLYQRLVIAGLSHLQVSALYAALDLIGIACAALLFKRPAAWPLCATALTVSACALWLFVVRTERNMRARLARA
jgi:UDP-N-acetylmuramyl pentapeptide phosphotransferase/UDP-N-acetylglucosamine-1-phosphate transferase